MEVDEILAARLIEAHRHRRPVAWRHERGPAELDDVYRVQRRVREALDGGARGTAWKVSPPRGGAGPTASPVPNAFLHASPGELDASAFRMLGVEVEIAFRFGRDVSRRSPAAPIDEVLDAVDTAFVLIELCDTRLADWSDATALWRLADFQSSGAIVCGSGVRDWRAIDYRQAVAELRVNGEVVSSRQGTHPSGDPSTLLAWTADHCARHADGLRAGDIVTTGSWTGMHFAAPGDTVDARFDGIGEARLLLRA